MRLLYKLVLEAFNLHSRRNLPIKLRIGILEKGVIVLLKCTGIVRQVDNVGRIVIPAELRAILGIKVKDPLEFFIEEKTIILIPYRPGCVFCGQMENLVEVYGKKVCSRCVEEAAHT
jgi:transcriptional pleiotropic regulator of transition state genes